MEQYKIKWNNHKSFVTWQYLDLLRENKFTDCTIATEGQSLKAHRIVLAAASPYFLVSIKTLQADSRT